MPAVKVFVDSNTFLYTVDEDEPLRGPASQDWLNALTRARAGATNLQVLNEVANVLIEKARFSRLDPFLTIDAFAPFGISPLTPSISVAARDVFKRYDYSWWDCLLLASALVLDCTYFLSEDLQDGQSITDGVRSLTIVNPFAHSPEHILTQ